MKYFPPVNAAAIISSYEMQYQQDTRCSARRHPIDCESESDPFGTLLSLPYALGELALSVSNRFVSVDSERCGPETQMVLGP
jgi:hypothetical protein